MKFPVGKIFQRLNYRLGFIEAEIDRLNRKGNGWLEIAFRPASDREIQRRASMTKDSQRHGYTGESRIEQIGSTGISRFVRKLGPIERRKKEKTGWEKEEKGEPTNLCNFPLFSDLLSTRKRRYAHYGLDDRATTIRDEPGKRRREKEEPVKEENRRIEAKGRREARG